MPFTLGICKVLLRYPGRRHPHANAFSLEPSFLEESPMNAGRPRTVWTQPVKTVQLQLWN
jgi:hypothetical protein